MKHVSWVIGALWILGLANEPAQAQSGRKSQAVGAGLEATYYNGTNFEQPVVRRRDAAIDFSWQKQQPVPGVGPDYFSVRWEGYLLAPVTGEYEFTTVMDDGLRVWVGGKRLINAWQPQNHVPAVARIMLKAGHYYRLRVDYFQDVWDSRALLQWRLPDQPQPVTVSGAQLFAGLPPSAKPVSKDAATSTGLLTMPAAGADEVPYIKLPAGVKATPMPSAIVVGRRPSTPASRPTTPSSVNPARRPPTPAPRRRIPEPARNQATPTADLNNLGSLLAGAVVPLQHLYFEQSKARLLPTSLPELERLALILKNNPALQLEIIGHTDNVGDANLNQELSRQRAEAVRDYLVRQGIAAERLLATGRGGAQPIANNDDPRQRPRNRRVEVVVR